METPVEIDFVDMEPQNGLRSLITARLADLETRFGRITAGRVVLKGPTRHHRTGAIYEAHIRLSLPQGREVNISRRRNLDERHADVVFALNDAFNRARRQLQDRARRMQEKEIDQHRAPSGVVASIDRTGDFGFLSTEDGREIYFHRNSVLDSRFDELQPGARVAYAEEAGNDGPQASTVRLLGKHKLR